MISIEEQLFERLAKRYAGATPEALAAVMCPLLIPIERIDRKVTKLSGQTHYRATFWIKITDQNETVIQVGRTGKFVSAAYLTGESWTEIVKGRIVSIDHVNGVAEGEIYTGESSQKALKAALESLDDGDFWEVDQYGASAKILSALAEHFLVIHGKELGYKVVRMPEDMARHLGGYANFDFLFEKDGRTQRVEAKSIWGTNTSYARLIHSTTTAPKAKRSTLTVDQEKNYYATSSCKYTTQDIFAVNLFLRTGNIRDFAFARSVPDDVSPHGLPRSSEYPEHLNQNPLCLVDNKVWFSTIDDVWDLK